jgi:hypothetical protein
MWAEKLFATRMNVVYLFEADFYCFAGSFKIGVDAVFRVKER